MKPRLHVAAIGGSHQFAHFLPVAFELARRGSADVKIFVPRNRDQRHVARMAQTLGMPVPSTTVMHLPSPLGSLVPCGADKLARLLAWAQSLRDCDGILCAERTSTLLKRLPGRCPELIHIPHGAGDGAAGFESRFRHFDTVIVAGSKDRNRLVASGLVEQDACAIAGPIKIASVIEAQAQRTSLFDNDRPVILYNPHFRPALSSAHQFTRRLAEAIARDGRYNLVIAPHIRLARQWPVQRRREWEALAIADRIIVDLGSQRSVDMTYTLSADLYIGDVSSQVYEFLVRPRPCLFVDAHHVDWRDDENYAMWRFGDVIRPDCDIIGAIDGAFDQHDAYRSIQTDRTRSALEGLAWTEAGTPFFPGRSPILRGADLVQRALERRPVVLSPLSQPMDFSRV